MSKVLVTGGLGYIGSHTAVALMELGHEVVIADNLANTSAEVLDGIEAITGSRPTWVEVDLADRGATAARHDVGFFARLCWVMASAKKH